jgi:hypothetical protein
VRRHSCSLPQLGARLRRAPFRRDTVVGRTSRCICLHGSSTCFAPRRPGLPLCAKRPRR